MLQRSVKSQQRAEFLRDKFRVGRWWYKGTEIDLVAVRKEEIAFFEVKWRDMSYQDAINVLKRLEEKAEAVTIKGKRSYGLIARKIEDKDRLGACVYDLSARRKNEKVLLIKFFFPRSLHSFFGRTFLQFDRKGL